MNMLLTNDDGYKAKGFYALLKELSNHFNVTAVAPTSQKSWIGKSISKEKELLLSKTKLKEFEIYTLDGTPADCVQIGIYDVLNNRPQLVISGINMGLNTGHGRILSSGTIGASMEASIDGIKSISSSIHIPKDIKSLDSKESVFQNAAKITVKIIKIFLDNKFPDNVDLLSINIPFDATINSEIEITKPHREPYGKLFHKKEKKFIHITPAINFNDLKNGTDLKALNEGKISVTPISLELIPNDSLEQVSKILSHNW